MVTMFERGKIYIAPSLNVSEYIIEDREDELVEKILAMQDVDGTLQICTPEDFEANFLPGLVKDLEILENLAARWGTVKEDPKLDEFVRRLEVELLDPKINHSAATHGKPKLVVFSESKETTDYLTESEETPRLRGRLDISGSMKRLSWQQGRMVCEFDELSHNVLHNRILKTTLEELWHAEGIGDETRDLIHRQLETLRLVDRVFVTSGLFRRIHLHRNNRFYRFLLNVCELVHESKLPEQRDGKNRFRDFVRDPKKMPYVFEAFVKNFYAREQDEFAVGSVRFEWAASCSEEARAVLPIMRTDVSLWSAERRIILDCKFYKEAMSGWHGGAKIHAGNLYQIYSYLRNAEHREGWEGSDGVLLYPAVNASFDHQFEIDGHHVRVVSVDLDRPWTEIHDRLRMIIH